jgi:hypothetical protein
MSLASWGANTCLILWNAIKERRLPVASSVRTVAIRGRLGIEGAEDQLAFGCLMPLAAMRNARYRCWPDEWRQAG